MQEWDQLLTELEKEVGSQAVAQWLRPLKKVGFDAGNLYLEAPDSFAANWFEEHIRPKLRLVNNNSRPIRVHLSVAGKNLQTAQKGGLPPFVISPDTLDPWLTLDNFIPTGSNVIAHQLLSDPAGFNPIYLYGGPKSGKTHLLMGAAHLLKNQGNKVFYVRAETFTEHVVQAIRLGQMTIFRNTYREIDVLIVDDIQIFAKKSATQEEFFHTFNSLHTMGRPVLLSANVPPSKLTEIEPRLVSRFEWGISLGLEPADAKAVLEKKAELWKMALSQDVVAFLVREFPKEPLVALQALAMRASGPVGVPAAEKLLADLLVKERAQVLTPEQIVKAVANHYGILSEDLMGKSQTREMATPRQVAMFLIRGRLKWPFQKIGDFFGRNHSTVMDGIKLIQKGIEERSIDLSGINL